MVQDNWRLHAAMNARRKEGGDFGGVRSDWLSGPVLRCRQFCDSSCLLFGLLSPFRWFMFDFRWRWGALYRRNGFDELEMRSATKERRVHQIRR